MLRRYDSLPPAPSAAPGWADTHGAFSRDELDALKSLGPGHPQRQAFLDAVQGKPGVQWPAKGWTDFGTQSQLAARRTLDQTSWGRKIDVDLGALADKMRANMPPEQLGQADAPYVQQLMDDKGYDVTANDARAAQLHAGAELRDKLAAGHGGGFEAMKSGQAKTAAPPVTTPPSPKQRIDDAFAAFPDATPRAAAAAPPTPSTAVAEKSVKRVRARPVRASRNDLPGIF